MDEEFKEKMDAMRMNLELAMHEIEAMGVKIEALREASASQYESIQVLANASESLLKNANRQGEITDRQQDDIDALKRITGDLVKIADSHDRRISGIEGQI
jgi:predicted  nucleic acid-binding Zn-ribbon protein